MKWREVSYKPLGVPLLTSEEASEALAAIKQGRGVARLSVDLGLSEGRYEVAGGYLRIGNFKLGARVLERVARDERSIYMLVGDGLEKVEVRDRHFYKLVKTSRAHAPTLEIDGVHMHRVSGVSPEEDAAAKVGLARRIRGALVLDTCMGLGYTALAALGKGAKSVITVEKDENVLRIAAINPWSRGLCSPRIKLILGDVSEYISSIPDSSIDVVIHDPPRVPLAGELYSSLFYSELGRVLRPRGELIHYVGSPGWRTGRRIYVGVLRRLRESGFAATWRAKLGVVYAYKATS